MRIIRGIGRQAAILPLLLAAGCVSSGGPGTVQVLDDGRKVRCLTACKEWERNCSTGAVVTDTGGASSVTRCRPSCKRYGKECYDVEE